MKLRAQLVWHQGLRLFLDETELGFFQCSGIDTLMLLCALELVDGVEIPHKQVKELREWIANTS